MKGALGHIVAVLLCLLPMAANAQTRFFNLTAGEVKIDSLLPNFTYAIPLEEGYEDSTYVVEITYPEFIDASASDVRKAVSDAAAIYGLYGAEDQLGLQEPEDIGRMSISTQINAIKWLKEHTK